MPAMRVLGLDPGSRRTGWGVVDRSGNQFRCVEHGCITPAARLDLPRRLHHLAKAAGAIIDRLAPEVVVVEEAFYHESVRSTLVLGHVRGALIVAAVERGIEVAEYTPREIKLAVVGNGGAGKEQVEFMVRRILGLAAPVQADAADALAGALCHLNRSRFVAARTGARPARRALEALLARSAR
jgi:crossover junction endodeoxyribonuclease RuvC